MNGSIVWFVVFSCWPCQSIQRACPAMVHCRPARICCMPTYLECVPAPVTVATSEPVPEKSADEKEDEDHLEAATALEGEDGLEFANFSSLTGSIDALALDWGVASIGPGTLAPTPGLAGRLVGGGAWFGGGSDSLPPVPQAPEMPCSKCCCPVDPPGGSGPPSPPVPEPASLATWLVVLSLGALWANRRRRRTV